MSEPFWVPLGASAGSLDPAGIGTTLPASPVDGQEYILVDSLTAPTFHWRFRYLAAKASNKWIFIGGTPITAYVDAVDSTASTAYVALANPGPSITVPVAGDYTVEVGSAHQGSSNNAEQRRVHSYDVGGTAALDVDAAVSANSSGNPSMFSVVKARRKSIAAGAAIVSKYKIAGLSTSSVTFQERWMRVTPIAVGG